jgi:hypothetical protein
MKRITLTNSAWYRETMTDTQRRVFLREIFHLADDKEWTIALGGEHHGSS